MRMRRLLVLAFVMFPGCTATRLSLPTDPVRLTIVQRQSKGIPGSNKSVRVRVGDITGRQVLLSIRRPFGGTIVDTVSVKKGDVVPFDLGDQRYFLKVVKLRNVLTGDDFGVFEVSSKPPRGRRIP